MEKFQKKQFLNSVEPYRYLHELKSDPIQHEQVLAAIKENARAVGIRNFEKLYDAYLLSLQ